MGEPLAVAYLQGSLVGGLIGASVGRRLPAAVLRGVIVVLGIVGICRIVSG